MCWIQQGWIPSLPNIQFLSILNSKYTKNIILITTLACSGPSLPFLVHMLFLHFPNVFLWNVISSVFQNLQILVNSLSSSLDPPPDSSAPPNIIRINYRFTTGHWHFFAMLIHEIFNLTFLIYVLLIRCKVEAS